MNQPKIPTYSDSENTVFHPVFHYALLEALKNRGLSDIRVEKQFKAPGGGLVDLVLLRKSTGRVILPIEIKRKMSSVRGQGRRQARDYQQNLSAQSENNFYCVSNLELTELFRWDPQRKTTTSQQIELVTPQDVRLENGQDHLVIPKLIKTVEEILDIILDGKPFKYLIGLSDLEVELGGTKSSGAGWHESLVPFCYEYIRGTTAFKSRTKSWKAAAAYNTNPKRIVDLGGAIDFENIFSQPVPSAKHFKSQILHDAYAAGESFGDGDDLAALVGDILYDSKKGIVETDYDLARLLAVVAGNIAGDIGPTGEILDPCAGSGKLLAALIHEKYPQITPHNVIAVEKEPYFAEALSLRLGLQFGDKISKTNSPRISIAPFEMLSPGMFSNVRIAVVNPPFISGINAVAAKNHMAAAIRSKTGHSPCLDVGQIGFEAMFMELLFRTVPDNATIAFIFPYTTISRLSKEFVRLREFLVGEMGVSHIITYLSDGVFDSVAKRTLIFVCTKGESSSNIKLVDIQVRVPDLNLCAFSEAFSDNTKSCYGAKFEYISRDDMSRTCACGWKAFFGIGKIVNDNIAKYAGGKKSLFDYAPRMRRGTVGNNGNTALTVFGRDTVPEHCPQSWLIGCLNNAFNMPRILDSQTAPDLSFIPPINAYTGVGQESRRLVSLVDRYIEKCDGDFSTKKQKTNVKDREAIIRGIKRDQRSVVNSIVLPRGCREDAKLGVIGSDPILVSTNFLLLPVADTEKRILLASWLQSVFGQLQIEMYSTSELGLRKLEKNALEKVYVPSLEAIPVNIRQRLVKCFGKEEFLSLDNVQPRESDRIWASLLAQDNAQQELDQSVELLSAAYDERVQ